MSASQIRITQQPNDTPPLSYVSGGSSVGLLGETVDGCLRRVAGRWGAREALVDVPSGRRLSYAELDAAVDGVARGLMGLGVVPGDRVAVWAPNCVEWVLVQYATARVGAVLVNVNPAYRVDELKFALNQSGARVLFSAVAYKSSDYRAMVQAADGVVRSLEHVVFIGDSSWEAMIAAGTSVSSQQVWQRSASLSFDDPVNIQYTSGTTGFPKGVTLSHHSILNNGFFVGELNGYTELDRICVPVPFYHCFGMVMGNLAALSHGAAVIIPAPTFDAAATLAAVQDERCTALYGVPTMFIAELDLANFAEFDLSSLRTGIMAGSPCPVEVMKRVVAEMHMPEVTICYGMTETSPVSTQTRPEDTLDRRVGTVGRVHPHLEIKIVDPDTDQIVPIGTAGELCTRGYSVMSGYWNQPDNTAEVLVNGWMHTGDLATMDEQGYICIVGRIKDMVIRGGENIYPREIEEFLYTHPDIIDAHVIGVPDALLGEELMAWIQLREDAEPITAEGLKAFAHGKLARYKIPRYVHLTADFPLTVTGKVRKNQMRQTAIDLLGLHTPT